MMKPGNGVLAKCFACDNGWLRPMTEFIEVTHRKVTSLIKSHFKICDNCGQFSADCHDINENADLMKAFRADVDEMLGIKHVPNTIATRSLHPGVRSLMHKMTHVDVTGTITNNDKFWTVTYSHIPNATYALCFVANDVEVKCLYTLNPTNVVIEWPEETIGLPRAVSIRREVIVNER